MTPSAILLALLQYGPAILPAIAQITTWIKEGKTEVTTEDIQTLIAFGKLKASDYILPGTPADPSATVAPAA